MGAWIHRPLPLRLRHCSPSASVADLPASATVPSHTLPLYSISLAEPHRGDSPTSPSSSSPSFPPPFFHSGHQDRAPPSSPASSSPHRCRPLSSAPSGRRNLTVVALFPLPPPVAGSHRPDALPFRLLPHPTTLLLPFPIAMASFFIAGTAVFLPGKAMTRSPYLCPRLSIGALLSPSFRPSPPTSPLSGFLSATVIVSPCQLR